MLAAFLGLALGANVAHAQEVGRPVPPVPFAAGAPAPETIAAAFEAALDNHDPGRAAVFLAEDARALVPGALQGRNAITQFLIGRYAADTSIDVSLYAANGARVTWMTRVSNGSHLQFNWDEAVIVESRIALWSERAGDQAVVVMPEFTPARTYEPNMLSRDGSADAARHAAEQAGPLAPGWLVLIGVLSSVVGGVLFGLWRERYHPPRGRASWQDGALLRGLRLWHESDTTLSPVRARSYNGARVYGPAARRNPRRFPDS